MIVKKITVTPVFGVVDKLMDGESFPTSDLPFEVGPGVFLADVHEQLRAADYSLWARDYLSKEDVKELQSWHYALVHYFDSEEYLTSEPEELSRVLVYRAFLGLRIVRPSWTPYQFLRATIQADGSFSPSGFSKAEGRLPVSSCDAANSIRRSDAELLKTIIPRLLSVYETGCRPVVRAIGVLELGYVSKFNDAKQLLWTTALDGMFTSAKHWGAALAIGRIKDLIGSVTRIYEAVDFPSYINLPTLTVDQVLPDIYKFRNKLAHGEWAPREFLERPGYRGKAGEDLNYADVLLEATGIILRKALIRILADNLIAVFQTKDALDWHFSRRGLVNKGKKQRGFSNREPSFH